MPVQPLAGLAGCGTGPASPGALPAYRPGPLPAVSGHGLTALWQGAPWDLQTVADGLVPGYQYANGRDLVRAVSALTGDQAPALAIGPVLYGSIAADGSLLAASFVCPGGRVLVQRLAGATGQLVWQWESPPAGSTQVALSVIGAARQGRLVLLASSMASRRRNPSPTALSA